MSKSKKRKTLSSVNFTESNVNYECFKVSWESKKNKSVKICQLVSRQNGSNTETVYVEGLSTRKYTVAQFFNDALDKLYAKKVIRCGNFDPSIYAKVADVEKAFENKLQADFISVAHKKDKRKGICFKFSTCSTVTLNTGACNSVVVTNCSKVVDTNDEESIDETACQDFGVCSAVSFSDKKMTLAFGSNCRNFGAADCEKIVKVKSKQSCSNDVTVCTKIATCLNFQAGKGSTPSKFSSNTETLCEKVITENIVPKDGIPANNAHIAFINKIGDSDTVNNPNICLNVNICYLVNRFGNRTCNKVVAYACTKVTKAKKTNANGQKDIQANKTINCEQVFPNKNKYKFDKAKDCNKVVVNNNSCKNFSFDPSQYETISQDVFAATVTEAETCTAVITCTDVNSNGSCNEVSRTNEQSFIDNFSDNSKNLCTTVTNCTNVSTVTGRCSNVTVENVSYIEHIVPSTQQDGAQESQPVACAIVNSCSDVNVKTGTCSDVSRSNCSIVTTQSINDQIDNPIYVASSDEEIIEDDVLAEREIQGIRILNECRAFIRCSAVTPDDEVDAKVFITDDDTENTETYTELKYILSKYKNNAVKSECKTVATCKNVGIVKEKEINKILFSKENITQQEFLDTKDFSLSVDNETNLPIANKYNIDVLPTLPTSNYTDLLAFTKNILINTFRNNLEVRSISHADIFSNISNLFKDQSIKRLSQFNNSRFHIYGSNYFDSNCIDEKYTKFKIAYVNVEYDDENIPYNFNFGINDSSQIHEIETSILAQSNNNEYISSILGTTKDSLSVFLYIKEEDVDEQLAKIDNQLDKINGVLGTEYEIHEINYSYNDMLSINNYYNNNTTNLNFDSKLFIKSSYDANTEKIQEFLVKEAIFNKNNSILKASNAINSNITTITQINGSFDNIQPITNDLQRIVASGRIITKANILADLSVNIDDKKANTLTITTTKFNEIKSAYYEYLKENFINKYDISELSSYKKACEGINNKIDDTKKLTYGLLLYWLLDTSYDNNNIVFNESNLPEKFKSPYVALNWVGQHYAYDFSAVTEENTNDRYIKNVQIKLHNEDLSEFKKLIDDTLIKNIKNDNNPILSVINSTDTRISFKSSDVDIPKDIASTYDFDSDMLKSYYNRYIKNANEITLSGQVNISETAANIGLKALIKNKKYTYLTVDGTTDEFDLQDLSLADILNKSLIDYFTFEIADDCNFDFDAEEDDDDEDYEPVTYQYDPSFDSFDDLDSQICLYKYLKTVERDPDTHETETTYYDIIITWYLNLSNFLKYLLAYCKFSYNEIPNYIKTILENALNYNNLNTVIKNAIVKCTDYLKAINKLENFNTAKLNSILKLEINKEVIDIFANNYAFTSDRYNDFSITEKPCILSKVSGISGLSPSVTTYTLRKYLENQKFTFKQPDIERFYFDDSSINTTDANVILDTVEENKNDLNVNILITKRVHLLDTIIDISNVLDNPPVVPFPNISPDHYSDNIDMMPFKIDDDIGLFVADEDDHAEAFLGATSDVTNTELDELSNVRENI